MSDKPEPTHRDAEKEIDEEQLEDVAGGITAADDWESPLKAPKPRSPSTNSFGGDEWERK